MRGLQFHVIRLVSKTVIEFVVLFVVCFGSSVGPS